MFLFVVGLLRIFGGYLMRGAVFIFLGLLRILGGDLMRGASFIFLGGELCVFEESDVKDVSIVIFSNFEDVDGEGLDVIEIFLFFFFFFYLFCFCIDSLSDWLFFLQLFHLYVC